MVCVKHPAEKGRVIKFSSKGYIKMHAALHSVAMD